MLKKSILAADDGTGMQRALHKHFAYQPRFPVSLFTSVDVSVDSYDALLVREINDAPGFRASLELAPLPNDVVISKAALTHALAKNIRVVTPEKRCGNYCSVGGI